ncbi:MAG: hypothetical protein K2G89_00185 [Lachnospiraceae bacterium]|nr:hypothetical protein [Lachnospiraceae bacterium]
MIGNELKKIWNVRMTLLLLLVSVTLFYTWIIGQMNLHYLPLFETVDATLGAKLLEQFGTTIDADELEQVAALKEGVRQDFEEKVSAAYPQLEEMGMESFEEFENDIMTDVSMEEAQTEQYQQKCELYNQITEEFGWELESIDFYSELLERKEYAAMRFKVANSDDYPERNKEQAIWDRIAEVTERPGTSVLPDSVTMNMNYVIQDFTRILLYLVLLLLLPYLALDNKSRVYPLAATTRRGRGLVKTQFLAMLIGLLPLLAVMDIALCVAYSFYTPYAVFNGCMVEYLWFDFTQLQYFWVQVLVCNLIALAFSMLVFFASAFCRTIVGTVVMALPCWGLGTLAGMFFADDIFSCNVILKSMPYALHASRYSLTICLLGMLLAGLLCDGWLIRRRKREDIML